MERGRKPDNVHGDEPTDSPFELAVFGTAGRFFGETLRTFGQPMCWPYALLEAIAEAFVNSSDPVYRGRGIRYGDGKPLVLVPGHLRGDVTLYPLMQWLRAVGYRPTKSGLALNVDDRLLDEPLAAALRTAAARVGRKAVVIAFNTGVRAALRVAAVHERHVSDVIALGLPDQWPPPPLGLRLHIIEASREGATMGGLNVHIVEGSRALLPVNPEALRILSDILREIPISLLGQI
jgi:hypothetical protein